MPASRFLLPTHQRGIRYHGYTPLTELLSPDGNNNHHSRQPGMEGQPDSSAHANDVHACREVPGCSTAQKHASKPTLVAPHECTAVVL